MKMKIEDEKAAEAERGWHRVAHQVLAGLYWAADDSTIASITTGLRSYKWPEAREAISRLREDAQLFKDLQKKREKRKKKA